MSNDIDQSASGRKLQLEIELLELEKKERLSKHYPRFSDLGLWTVAVAAVAGVANLVTSCSQNTQSRAELSKLTAEFISLESSLKAKQAELNEASAELSTMRAETLRAGDEVLHARESLSKIETQHRELSAKLAKAQESERALHDRLGVVVDAARKATTSQAAAEMLSQTLASDLAVFNELPLMDDKRRELAIAAIQSIPVIDVNDFAIRSGADYVGILDMQPSNVSGEGLITLIFGVQRVSQGAVTGVWQAELIGTQIRSVTWNGSFELSACKPRYGSNAVVRMRDVNSGVEREVHLSNDITSGFLSLSLEDLALHVVGLGPPSTIVSRGQLRLETIDCAAVSTDTTP